MSDITILIQGPLHETSVSNIEIYKRYGDVIYITWADGCTVDNLDLINTIHSNCIKFVSLPKDILNNSIHNKQNIFYQAYSTYYGCVLSATKNIIKVRSDEKYTNLDALITKINNQPNKIISSNIFFRKYSFFPYHISDHIIAGDTINITNLFLNVVKSCCNINYLSNTLKNNIINIPRINRLAAEQIITLNTFNFFYNNSHRVSYTDKNFCIEYMRKNFDIIDIRNLGDFIVTYKDMSNTRRITSDFNFFTNYNTDIIQSMDEYV